MAKVAFTKLKCQINKDEVPVQIGEETIAVKQYLPIQNKLELIGRVIELAHEQDQNFSNPVKANVFTELEIIFAYTNISFTEKQKEDLPKLYDLLSSSEIMNIIFQAIPKEEIQIIKNGVKVSIEAFYQYQNSIVGILDTIKTDYSNMELDVNSLVKDIADPESLGLLKDILTKMN